MVMQQSFFATMAALLAALLLPLSNATITQLNSTEFRDMAEAGEFKAIIDVRTKAEWDSGHIINATLMDSLQNAGTAEEISKIADLNGCEFCPIVVYCRSGSRAAQALQKLQLAGFQGPLYNGLGVNQWQEAGFELVTTASTIPPCKGKDPEASATCEASAGEGTLELPEMGDAFGLSDEVKVTVTMPDEPPTLETEPPKANDASSAYSLSSSILTTLLVVGPMMMMMALK